MRRVVILVNPSVDAQSTPEITQLVVLWQDVLIANGLNLFENRSLEIPLNLMNMDFVGIP